MCIRDSLSPVLRGVWQLLDELADNSRSHFAVCRYRLLNRLVWEAPHFMTPFSLSEKDPALGLHELDHVTVLLRLRHNYILGPPRLQDQAHSRLLVKLRVNGACLLAQGDNFLQDRRVRARRLRPGGDQGSFVFYEQIHDLILSLQRSGAGPHLVMHAIKGMTCGEERFADLDDHAVIGIDDIGYRRLGDLAEQLVCIHLVEIEEFTKPTNHLELCDPPGILHRARRPNDHPMVIRFESGPQRGFALDQFHHDGRIHRALDSGAAGFPLTLSIVSIPDREQSTLDVDAEVRGRSCLHLGRVHISAKSLRHERGANLAARRGDADSAKHWSKWQRHLKITKPRLEADSAGLRVNLVNPGGLRQGLLKQGGSIGAGHPAEERYRRRSTPTTCRREVNYVDCQGVSRLGPLDIKRSGLRVEVPEVQYLAGDVIHRRERVVERVLRPQLEHRSRPHSHYRRGTAEGVSELRTFRFVFDGFHASDVRWPAWARQPAGRRRTGQRSSDRVQELPQRLHGVLAMLVEHGDEPFGITVGECLDDQGVLVYTSDAADDLTRVDLGGGRV